tara:strand:- start:526 stop:1197 length:672 start_codon:yes stop_codon:yes gene_type:complete
MKAMILAAGLGKRLMPLTQHTPKPLILIGKQSLIERNIFCLKQNGISEIIINVSYQGEMIIDYVSQKFPDLNISFSKEDELLGTGGAILNALPFFNEKPFLLMNADIFHNIEIKNLPQDTKKAHLVGVPNPNHNINGDFSLKQSIVSIANRENDLTWSGISVINPIIFKENSFQSNSFNIWDSVLPKYIDNGEVTGEKSNELWIDVGTSDRLELANQILKEEN